MSLWKSKGEAYCVAWRSVVRSGKGRGRGEKTTSEACFGAVQKRRAISGGEREKTADSLPHAPTCCGALRSTVENEAKADCAL